MAEMWARRNFIPGLKKPSLCRVFSATECGRRSAAIKTPIAFVNALVRFELPTKVCLNAEGSCDIHIRVVPFQVS